MKILVATDGSEASRAAIRFADRLAGSLQAVEIVVITVGALRRELFVSHPEHSGLRLDLEIEKEEREIAWRTLSAAERELKRHRESCRFRFVQPRRHGPVAETIAQEADRERADLIVVGTDRFGASRAGLWAASRRGSSRLRGGRSPSCT